MVDLTKLVKPSQIDISNGLIGSGLNKTEKEIVVCNIISLSQENNDEWLYFVWETYKEKCKHKVTDRELYFLNELVRTGYLENNSLVYGITNKLIACLWDFVKDE